MLGKTRQFVIGAAEKHFHVPLSTEFATIALNETAGKFAPPRCTVIRDSSTPLATYGSFENHSVVARQTVARRSLTQDCLVAPCRWVVDFSDALVFGGIDSVDYTFEVVEGFPTAGLHSHYDSDTLGFRSIQLLSFCSRCLWCWCRSGAT